eukprot:SM000358S13179  [mRNA]  locus=s358:532:1706:+ [translate_table: standard]
MCKEAELALARPSATGSGGRTTEEGGGTEVANCEPYGMLSHNRCICPALMEGLAQSQYHLMTSLRGRACLCPYKGINQALRLQLHAAASLITGKGLHWNRAQSYHTVF